MKSKLGARVATQALIASLLCGSSLGLAAPTYYFDTGVADQAQLAPLTILGQMQQNGYNTGIVQQTAGGFAVPDINLHVLGCFPNFCADIRAGASAQGSLSGGLVGSNTIDGGVMRGSVRAYAPDVIFSSGPVSTVFSTAHANLNELWVDTGHVSGTPGSTVQVLLTLHFSGGVSVTGAGAASHNSNISAFDAFDLGAAGGISCVQFCLNSNGFDRRILVLNGSVDETDSVLLSLQAGTELSLEHQFILLAQTVGDVNAISEATVSAIDTAWSSFQVLTPGAALSWDSGLTYQLVPVNQVPEPGTIALFGIGLFGLAYQSRARNKGA